MGTRERFCRIQVTIKRSRLVREKVGKGNGIARELRAYERRKQRF